MPKKPKKDGDRKSKSKPVAGLSTKPSKVKQPNAKGKRAPAAGAKPVCQPKMDLSTAPGRPQTELFPIEKKPVLRKIEAPGVDPALPPPPPGEPAIAKDIAYPPESSFTAPILEGTLAHHLIQPASRVDQVVQRTFQKVRYHWISEWTGAADAGDPCIRKLVYQRLQPEAALPDEGEMAFLFKHGTWVEKEVLDEMAQSGYEVVEQQRPFHDENLKVKGKIDGKLVLHHGGARKRPPFEVKGYAPHTWEQINSAKDMLDAHQGYLKKVPAQVMLYLVLDKQQDADAALLYMKNKLTGKPKSVVVPRDNVYAEWLLRRLKMVREHVQAKTLPARIEFEESTCGKCPFRGVCLSEMPAGPNPLVLDPEKAAMLLELLELWWANNDARKVWKEVDDKIAGIVRNHAKIIVGDFIVTGTPGTQKRIDEAAMTPDDLKKFKREFPTWRKGIVNVKDTKGSGVTE
jgi:CRISPR/Cas system-associated exonuclease Cas4 (RecB family)